MILDLPLHLYHFTPQTMSQVLKASGFKAVKFRLTNPDWLEWFFSMLAGLRGAASETTPDRKSDAGVTAAGPRRGRNLRRRWQAAIGSQLRERFPGWKFQVWALPEITSSAGEARPSET